MMIVQKDNWHPDHILLRIPRSGLQEPRQDLDDIKIHTYKKKLSKDMLDTETMQSTRYSLTIYRQTKSSQNDRQFA